MSLDPTQRFSSRVESYARYRPSYPTAVLEHLCQTCGLGAASTVADVGAGTGIFSCLLLESGASVVAVEPNEAMRRAAVATLRDTPRFRTVAGSAERTTLEARAFDLVTCAQAFHWFDRETARSEFARILKPGGRVALIWNRRVPSTAFDRDYEAFLNEHANAHGRVSHEAITDAELERFFAPGVMASFECANAQSFDLAGLEGRTLSASYTPEPGHAQFEPMRRALRRLFDTHAEDGTVTLAYRCTVTTGQLDRLEAS